MSTSRPPFPLSLLYCTLGPGGLPSSTAELCCFKPITIRVHTVRTETNTFKDDGERYCYSDYNRDSELVAFSIEYYREQCLEQISRSGLYEELGDDSID